MTPASSGLCSETWAWVEGNFVFHLFSSSVLKNLALFKNNAEKLKQNKAHGFGICFYIQSSHICDPKSYFSKNMICFKETVAWLCAFPLKYLFENSAVVMVWKRPSIRIQIQKKYGAFCQQIPTPFQIKIHLQTPLCIFVIMAFFEVNVYNYQKDVPSKLCKISSNAKTKFQISRWSSFVYVMVLLSKAYVIPWRMCAKSHFIFKKLWGRWGRHNIPPRQWNFIPKCIYIYDPFDVLSEIIWISLRAEGISFGKYPLQKWWKRSIKKSAQLVHIE